jgi:hypothetical protein
MPQYPPLTAEFCLHVAVDASPFSSRFKQGDDPTVKTLFDLGVATATDSAMYAQGVKTRIFPWHIDSSAVASSPGTTVQSAADSIQVGAFKE